MGTDRRIRYTQMVLKDALIELLQEKPLSKITVTEICQKADVNRGTYYLHYANQFDQMDKLEASLCDGIIAYLDQLMVSNDATTITEGLLEYILENRALCCALLGEHAERSLEERLQNILHERIFTIWDVKARNEYSMEEYVYLYVISGSLSIVRRWLYDSNNQSTVGVIAKLINRLYLAGGSSIASENV